ncbi:unnamed protein product [Adineta ricciae]|uniref:NAD(P)(+)--arginine ADP-ribosyltransferase n=1 Tax=Adineta ricciae TaxID=249248 RepID=A0A814YRV6_ADIRI|nr:unnamed protein product [Adineta ricciae]CAF1612138.1 unnamed protein product [Adineta ricciae]
MPAGAEDINWKKFYTACQNGDLNTVQLLLPTLKSDQLNKHGANKNTALHVASCHGYSGIVELLLQHPDIDHTLKDLEGRTPFKSALDDQIKQLFLKVAGCGTEGEYNRFIADDDIEWHDTYPNAYRIAKDNHDFMEKWLTKIPLKKLLIEIQVGYLDLMKAELWERMKSDDDYADLAKYLREALDKNNPLPLIKMYTADTNFYHILNADLAKLGSGFRFTKSNAFLDKNYRDDIPPRGQGQYLFAAILINHDIFQSHHFTGKVYRGMKISSRHFSKYSIGSSIITRSFHSASKLDHVARSFAGNASSTPGGMAGRLGVLFIYHIKNPRTGLDIIEWSTLSEEEEILIAPFSAFKIIQVKRNHGSPSEIEFEECEA